MPITGRLSEISDKQIGEVAINDAYKYVSAAAILAQLVSLSL